MKKLMTVVFTMLVAGCLAFGQDTGGTKDTKTPAKTETTGKKGKSKAHKGGKKSKKGSTSTTPPPK